MDPRRNLKRASALLFFLILAAALSLLPYGAAPVRADENYGERAYELLTYIDANLPYRVSDASLCPDDTAKRNAGEWIRNTLESFGYEVEIREWDHEGTTITSYIAERPGVSPKKLVLGAHYDSVNTKGVDDNGTGVALLLELAERFSAEEAPLSLVFGFWDGEETHGFAGSYNYVANTELSEIVGYINLDTLGAGDTMFAYGGAYEDGELKRDWMLNMALSFAGKEGIDLQLMPEAVAAVREDCVSPTRLKSSDHFYFNANGIPYVYFESNAWVKPDGTLGNTETPHLYNSSLEAFRITGGQILHTVEFEDLATLNELVPGRVKSHLEAFSRLVTEMIRTTDTISEYLYDVPETLSEGSEASSMTEASLTQTSTVPETTVLSSPAETSSDISITADTAPTAKELRLIKKGKRIGFTILGICGAAFLLSVIMIIRGGIGFSGASSSGRSGN